MTLRVKLEIVPLGDEDRVREIGRLDIFNKGEAAFGHYKYGVIEFDPENNEAGMLRSDILHRRHLGAWELVRKVLQERQKGIEMNDQISTQMAEANKELPWEHKHTDTETEDTYFQTKEDGVQEDQPAQPE